MNLNDTNEKKFLQWTELRVVDLGVYYVWHEKWPEVQTSHILIHEQLLMVWLYGQGLGRNRIERLVTKKFELLTTFFKTVLLNQFYFSWNHFNPGARLGLLSSGLSPFSWPVSFSLTVQDFTYP